MSPYLSSHDVCPHGLIDFILFAAYRRGVHQWNARRRPTVPGKIQREIQQNKPIPSLEEEAYLNVQRTANMLLQGLTEVLRRHDLTPTQYNVLRILRGAGEKGLTAGEVGDRMITR